MNVLSLLILERSTPGQMENEVNDKRKLDNV